MHAAWRFGGLTIHLFCVAPRVGVRDSQSTLLCVRVGVAWPLELGLGTHNRVGVRDSQCTQPRVFAWPLQLGLGWPLELGLGTHNPRFFVWPLELGLGTHNSRFVAWPLELGLGTHNPLELGLETHNPPFLRGASSWG